MKKTTIGSVIYTIKKALALQALELQPQNAVAMRSLQAPSRLQCPICTSKSQEITAKPNYGQPYRNLSEERVITVQVVASHGHFRIESISAETRTVFLPDWSKSDWLQACKEFAL